MAMFTLRLFIPPGGKKYNKSTIGQQKQIVKNENVKKLFDLYGVEYSE